MSTETTQNDHSKWIWPEVSVCSVIHAVIVYKATYCTHVQCDGNGFSMASKYDEHTLWHIQEMRRGFLTHSFHIYTHTHILSLQAAVFDPAGISLGDPSPPSPLFLSFYLPEKQVSPSFFLKPSTVHQPQWRHYPCILIHRHRAAFVPFKLLIVCLSDGVWERRLLRLV